MKTGIEPSIVRPTTKAIHSSRTDNTLRRRGARSDVLILRGLPRTANQASPVPECAPACVSGMGVSGRGELRAAAKPQRAT